MTLEARRLLLRLALVIVVLVILAVVIGIPFVIRLWAAVDAAVFD